MYVTKRRAVVVFARIVVLIHLMLMISHTMAEYCGQVIRTTFALSPYVH